MSDTDRPPTEAELRLCRAWLTHQHARYLRTLDADVGPAIAEQFQVPVLRVWDWMVERSRPK